jgi:hypothetical protein
VAQITIVAYENKQSFCKALAVGIPKIVLVPDLQFNFLESASRRQMKNINEDNRSFYTMGETSHSVIAG